MVDQKPYLSQAVERSVLHQTIRVTTVDDQPLVISRWRPASAKRGMIPIMLVPGLGQNRYTWHMSRLSMVNYLLDRGMDVFVPEFRGHGLSRVAGSHSPKGFSDYVFKDMPAIIGAILDRGRYDGVFYCGHSLGGTIGYALDPALDRFIRGYVFIGAPSHFGKGLNLLRLGSRVLDMAVLKRLQERAKEVKPDPDSEPMSFPVDLIGRGVRAGLRILNSPVNFLPYNLWYPGSMDERDLQERIVMGFDKTSTAVVKLMLIWASRGRFVDENGSPVFEKNLRAKKAPSLFIMGDRDEVVPYRSMRPAYRMISSKDKTWKEINIKETGVHWGHIDLINGRSAPEAVWKPVADWVEAR
jgi:pimeloyl-ACP methyl ester carboxylesterase